MSNPQSQIPNSQLQEGNSFSDDRGKVTFNNDFNAAEIKRLYFIENNDTTFVRGWQGHQIEKRWFVAVKGSFTISVINLDDFNNPSPDLKPQRHKIYTDNFPILHVPPGNITSIQALEANSKLMVMSDYLMGEIQDEYRFPIDYFKNTP
jgi:hypothetical protein